MSFRRADRAQSVQIGAVLLLGIAVLGLAVFQLQVVPAETESAEFDHSQRVQGELADVRNALLRAATAGGAQAETVRLGTRYPRRLLLVNPPPATGSLRAAPAGGAAGIGNARAVGDAETADFWNGSARTYDAGRLSYTPRYNRLSTAPTTVYEASVLYNEFDDGTQLPRTDQRLVRGDRLTLVTLDGSLSRAGAGDVSVAPEAVSPATRTVSVTGDGGPIELSVPTGLSEAVWEELLEPEYASNGGNVARTADNVSVSGGVLTVELDGSETYDLRMARVGVGNGVVDTEAAYLTDVSVPDGQPTGSTRRVVVEVRDDYNNPKSGATVAASVDEGSLADATVETGPDGRAVFEYTAPGSATTDEIRLTFAGYGPDDAAFDGGDPESAAFALDVVSTGGAASREYAARWDTTRIVQSARAKSDVDSASYDSDADTLRFELSADNTEADVEMIANATQSGEPVEGVDFDYATNDSTVVDFDGNDPGQTGPDGEVSLSATVAPGTAAALASANADGDTVDVVVVGPGDFSSVAASDLTEGGNDQAQAFSFTLDGDLPAGETVEVDLSDAQGTNPTSVDYRNANVDSTTGSGSASISANGETITYTAGGSDADGDAITIELAGVDAGRNAGNNAPFDVVFTRDDSGASATATFDVN